MNYNEVPGVPPPQTGTNAFSARLERIANRMLGKPDGRADSKPDEPDGGHKSKLGHLRIIIKTLKTFCDAKQVLPRGCIVCPPLTKELRSNAVRYVLTQLINSVNALKLKKFVDARHRVDVPHGMFGFSMDNFFNRRQIKDTLYMDVLDMVRPNVLQDVKDCIVLDELNDYLARIVGSLDKRNLRQVIQDLNNAKKLLSIEEVLRAEFNKNRDELQVLRLKLNSFQKYERESTDKLNSMVYDAMNECADSELVKTPIEYRFQLGFQIGGLDQYKLKLNLIEERMKDDLTLKGAYHQRENLTSFIARDKLKADIDMLREQISYFGKRYDHDFDRYDGDIVYLTNTMEVMHNQRVDCLKLMAKFAAEMPGLREWEADRAEKERKRLKAQLAKEEKERQREEAREAAKLEREIRELSKKKR